MSDFDVVVIGGGPAGCYAALTAAKKGCRVAIFEEHRAIGWPRHDPGWLMESEFTESVISALSKVLSWTKVEEYRVCNAESGDLIEKSSPGGYLVRRDLLDREIATSAVQAGVSLYLNTKVVKLIRKQGRVEEIETSSDAMPRVKGGIFICADGIRSASNGFAVQEGLCERSKVHAGTSYLLANADVSAGIVEHFISSDFVLNQVFWPYREGVCFVYRTSFAPLHELKEREDNVVSRKIKNAYALEVGGYAFAFSGKYGEHFKDIVRDNVMFVGDASGGSGNIHGMIQGQFAGSVAASAIKEHDVSERRLREYQDLVLNTLGRAPFFYLSATKDFSSLNDWFREFEKSTKGVRATELTDFP